MRFYLLASITVSIVIVLSAAPTRAPGAVWQIIDGGAGTVCAYNTPYYFFARTGVSAERVAIFFQPGGGCWSFDTCYQGSVLFDAAVSGSEPEGYSGIFDFADADNPLRDFDIVFVPYCTGDVHLGESVQVYRQGLGRGVTIRHNGYRNSRAALDWMYANYPAPTEIVIAGSSGGAAGALLYAGDVITRYPDARAVYIGDSYVGITPPRWHALELWNAGAHLPEYVTGNTLETFTLEGLYRDIATQFPDVKFAVHTQAYDLGQLLFFVLSGGSPTSWAAERRALLERIAQLPNLRTFVSSGFAHVVLVNTRFSETLAGAVRFRDWMRDLILGAAVENVSCVLGTLDCP